MVKVKIGGTAELVKMVQAVGGLSIYPSQAVVLPKLRTSGDTPPPALIVREGAVYADSRDVAAYFKKAHKHVLEKIREAPGSVEFQRSNFRPIKIKDLTVESTSHFEMTKDGFTLLAMGYTGKEAIRFKVAYIEEFNRMERELRLFAPPPQPVIPRTFVEALRLAADEAEGRMKAEAAKALAEVEVKRLKPMALIGERAAPFERTLKRVMQTFPGVNITATKRDLERAQRLAMPLRLCICIGQRDA